MNPALNTAATGMSAQQTRTDVIANNLANVDTTSFKSSRPNFVDLLYQTVQNQQTVATGDASTTPAIQVGRGTRLVGIERVQSQGALTQTSSPTDLGINGEGYFQVQQANGTISYTRDGSFQISDQGALVTSDGLTVVPGIKIPANSSNLTVSSNGIVTVTQPGATTTTELGRVELANFANPAGLLALGGNLFQPTPASGEAVTGYPGDEGVGTLQQGYLEGSNVDIVQEMVNMIDAQRAYEINSKAIANSDTMMGIANNLLRS
jgi:flagellar basal-body rod protein FlgG